MIIKCIGVYKNQAKKKAPQSFATFYMNSIDYECTHNETRSFWEPQMCYDYRKEVQII